MPWAAAVPIIEAVAPAVLGAGATMVAANQQKQAAKPFIRAQTDLAHEQQLTAEQLRPYIGSFYTRAQEAYDPAAAYYKALASGNSNDINRAVAPQLSDIASKYRSIISATRQMQPRSGVSAAGNTGLAFQAADEAQAARNAAISSAYPNLVKMAGTASDIGAGAAGLSTRAGEGASGLFGTAMNSRNALAQSQMGAYSQAARGLFDAYQGYKGASNGKGGGTGTSVDWGAGQQQSPFWGWQGFGGGDGMT